MKAKRAESGAAPYAVVFCLFLTVSLHIGNDRNNQSINRGTDGRKIVRPWSNAWTMVTGGWIGELVYLWVVILHVTRCRG